VSEPTTKKPYGFAAMPKERQREIASMGGRAVKAQNRSFSRNRTLAMEAGAKGGKSVPAEKRTFSTDRSLATRAGIRGGQVCPNEKRSFSTNRELAREAGRKGGGTNRKVETAGTEEGQTCGRNGCLGVMYTKANLCTCSDPGVHPPCNGCESPVKIICFECEAVA